MTPEDMVDECANVVKNAEEMAKDIRMMKGRSGGSRTRGTNIIFLDFITKTSTRDHTRNIEYIWRDQIWYFARESEQTRNMRHDIFDTLTTNVFKQLDCNMWAKVKYGDVHGLIEAIKTRFRLDDEKDAEIAIKKMNEIVKQKDETFDAFLDRFDKQLTDLTDVVELDSKQIEYYARKSMRESNDTDMHEVRENVMTMQPDLKEERVIMEHMRKIMKMRESKLNENQKVMKTKFDPKQKTDKKHPPYAYVCLEYQKDRCKRGGRCYYEHRKLNGQEAKQLEDFMKKKRELRKEIDRKNNEKEKVMKTQILEMTKKMDDMTKMMSEMKKKQN